MFLYIIRIRTMGRPGESEGRMKTFAKVSGWLTIIAAVVLSASVSRADSLGAMRVVIEQGDVQVKIADTGEWVPASINMPLVEGDELWVPEGSRAALQTNNGVHIRLDGDTALQVLRMDRDSFQFYLPQGSAYVLSLVAKRSVLQFDTPDTSIRSFGRATFRIDTPGAETDVFVFKGSVLAENDAGTTTVRAGSMLALGADGYADLSPLPSPDGWDRWNRERDRVVLARGEGYRHLPEELRTYSSDFDANGRWVSVPDYGYVWTPTVLVISDWAPYRHGRWVWRGGDYVWVGYEPWGWAPYHYGRWAFVARVGWCWVPPPRGEVFWAPGYVGWVRTGDYVAWVPLAPRETYYGHGNYGRYSVNITNVNINQVRVTNVYRNVNVTNSITVINQTTFVTGRHAPVDRKVVVNVREDFAKRRNIVVGRPSIKPAETSYVPVVRSIPESKRPPAAVRKIEAKQVRQSRPLVKEQDRSTRRPEAKPRTMDVRKVEKPKPAIERAKERKQIRPVEQRPAAVPEERRPAVPPAEKRSPAAPVERRSPAAPQERVAPERPQRAPERVQEKEKPKGPPEEKKVLERQPAKPERQIEREKPREEPAGSIRPQVAPVEKAKPREAPVEKATPRAAPVERATPKEAPVERAKPKETPVEKAKPRVAPVEKAKPEQAERGKTGDADKKDEGGGDIKGKAREDKGNQDNSSRGVRERDDLERPRRR